MTSSKQHDSSLTLRTNATQLTTSGGSVASESVDKTNKMNALSQSQPDSSRQLAQDLSPTEPDVTTGLMTNKTVVSQTSNHSTSRGHFSTINSFILYMCFCVMLTNALNVGYRNSVLTTIEKCYEFSSIISGILSGCLELGSLLATLIVSYFCAKSHIPRSIGFATLVCSLGSIIYALPHFMSESYTNNNKVINKTTSDIMCKAQTTTPRSNYSEREEWRNSPMSEKINPFGIDPECLLKPSQYGHFVTMIIANVLLGISSAPLYTLGTAYIDNHVSQENSSVYLGFIYSMLAFGPLVGYLVGAAILQFYVDSFSVKDLKLNPGDSDWVGAWYVGFILFSILIFFNSFPFFCFPRNIKKEYDEPEIGPDSQQEQEQNDNSFGHFKDLPKAIWNLLANRIFMIVTFAYCFEITIISGFITFLPKYIEHQFMLNNSLANIFTGSVAIPGAVAGILTGGFLVKKLKVNPKLASMMAISSNIVCLVGILGLIFVGCPNIPMAGTTIAYKTDFKDLLNKPRIEAITLNSECNSRCQCSLSSIEPICGRDGVSYFSPCYAGCTVFGKASSSKSTQTYSSCKCIQQELKESIGNYTYSEVDVPDAQAGLCHPSCDKLLPFLVILFLITFLTALNQMPMLMVTLRSVTEIERAFALGIQLVFMRLLAYIPSPLIFGQAIDWTCLVWRKNECEQVGSCLLYDRERFRYIYGSIAAVYKCISLVLFALLFFSVRNTNYNQKPATKTASVVFKTSAVSLNLVNNNADTNQQD